MVEVVVAEAVVGMVVVEADPAAPAVGNAPPPPLNASSSSRTSAAIVSVARAAAARLDGAVVVVEMGVAGVNHVLAIPDAPSSAPTIVVVRPTLALVLLLAPRPATSSTAAMYASSLCSCAARSRRSCASRYCSARSCMNRVYCPGPGTLVLAAVLVLAADVLVLAADVLALTPAPACTAAHTSLALIPLIALGNLPPRRSANTSEASCTPARNASELLRSSRDRCCCCCCVNRKYSSTPICAFPIPELGPASVLRPAPCACASTACARSCRCIASSAGCGCCCCCCCCRCCPTVC
ncbi:hypothetical protein C8J57DRAFT_1321701 [Mycena rebaudengoi]|nr:hypothetical protein C8J57DRAFT_1321701 [Mycena rebaudengoi]